MGLWTFPPEKKITPEKSVFPLKKNRIRGFFSFFVSVWTKAAPPSPFNGSRLQVRFPNRFNGEDNSSRWTPGHPPLEASSSSRFFTDFFWFLVESFRVVFDFFAKKCVRDFWVFFCSRLSFFFFLRCDFSWNVFQGDVFCKCHVRFSGM